jgi:uncharacterized membrane protein YqjE
MSDATGLMVSIRRLLDTMLSIVQTRVELLATELEDERVRIGQLLLYGAIAFFLFGMAILLVTTLIVAAYWDNHLLLVLSGLAALFVIAGSFAVLAFRKIAQKRFRFFSGSLDELAEDRDWIFPRS